MHVLRLSLSLAVVTAGCSSLFESKITQIAVRLEASPLVATPGDTVTFTVNVVGNDVSGVTIEFGDSNGDQEVTGGGTSASVTFKHAYSATGSYMSRATVSDAVVGRREVTQLISVTPKDTTQPPVGFRIVGGAQK